MNDLKPEDQEEVTKIAEYLMNKEDNQDNKSKEYLCEKKNMTKFREGGRTYYTTRIEAESVRRKGDRIYYSTKYRAYYIRRINEPFWGW